jgi:hypothetical protein
MLGDFYREPDDICRGLTLPAQSSEGMPLGLPMDGLFMKGGDCYAAPDAMRGITLADDFPQYGLGLAPPPPAFGCGMDFNYPSKDLNIKDPFSQQATERFQEGHVAWPKPTDVFYPLEATTLNLLCYRVDLLMNTLLDFMNITVVSSSVKVNTKKCTIKANVFVDNVMCTLKARCYQLEEPGKVALEFQKRNGDGITFTGIYRKFAKHVEENYHLAGVQSIDGQPQEPLGIAPPPLPLIPKGKVDVQDYVALLDMAASSHMPDLQADAAGALASSSKDPEVADALTSDEMAMQDMAVLLEQDRLDIDLPAAELYSNLARSGNVHQHFDGLLGNLVRKVQRFPVIANSHDAKYEAKRRFAEALATATACCRQRLSEQVVGQLAAEVHQVMSCSKDVYGNPDAAFGNLQTAYFNLAPQAIPA